MKIKKSELKEIVQEVISEAREPITVKKATITKVSKLFDQAGELAFDKELSAAQKKKVNAGAKIFKDLWAELEKRA